MIRLVDRGIVSDVYARTDVGRSTIWLPPRDAFANGGWINSSRTGVFALMSRQAGFIIPRTDISFHVAGDDAILLDGARGRLFFLSTDEATAWCMMCAHRDAGRAAADLAAASDRPAAEARKWLDSALAQWSDAGLLGTMPKKVPAFASVRRGPPKLRRRYRLLDIVVEITFDDPGDAEAASALLAGFDADAPAEIAVALIHEQDGCAVVVDGHVTERASRLRQAIPTLKLALVRLALAHASGRAALHAAAVGREGRAVLLPAPAGAGKSTLAAACALSNGWELLADDTVVLDEAWRVRALPFAICLKSGGWPVVTRLGASIDTLPIHERQDGQLVRYLLTPRHVAAAQPVAAVVIPRWAPGNLAKIAPMTVGSGARAVIPQLYPLATAFDADFVDDVARLVERVPCFELWYDSPADGVALLERVFRHDPS